MDSAAECDALLSAIAPKVRASFLSVFVLHVKTTNIFHYMAAGGWGLYVAGLLLISNKGNTIRNTCMCFDISVLLFYVVDGSLMAAKQTHRWHLGKPGVVGTAVCMGPQSFLST